MISGFDLLSWSMPSHESGGHALLVLGEVAFKPFARQPRHLIESDRSNNNVPAPFDFSDALLDCRRGLSRKIEQEVAGLRVYLSRIEPYWPDFSLRITLPSQVNLSV
jgi:hypothetical protein